MKKLIPLLTLLCLAFAGPVLAHVKQSCSVPADNAMLMQAPDVLSISFSGPIRLTKVTLLHDNGNTVDFGFTPTAVATQFSWPLPVLEIGSYQVNWVGLGEDGHKMKGDFSFMLHAGADAGVKADSAHAHQH
ncbi:copper resistance CopC family protein [Rheinheimera soli]|jgi:methionine-rich copper-binding protein CopC|uniref:copper resistance CopC family protein n=1 Tax=Rheinheimera soli TaxID=443616 RepID=UPI001E2ABCF5|nr:copper resistance CopC family protein [Rheinheimera soli]